MTRSTVARKLGARDENWRTRISAQERSGMSVKQFCKQQGLTEQSFYYWPIVEGLLSKPLLLAELFYRHPTSLLCRDPRAPILVSCSQFPCHSRSCHASTMQPGERRWKRGSSDAYDMWMPLGNSARCFLRSPMQIQMTWPNELQIR